VGISVAPGEGMSIGGRACRPAAGLGDGHAPLQQRFQLIQR
jgi:hypothetical protein